MELHPGSASSVLTALTMAGRLPAETLNRVGDSQRGTIVDHINSIVLEGTVKAIEPIKISTDAVLVTVENKRGDTSSAFPVIMLGNHAKACHGLNLGSRIRIVGFLRLTEGQIFIIAESMAVK